MIATAGQTVDQQGKQNTVGIWDAATGASAATLASFSTTVLSVAFGPDGRTFAVGGIEGKAWLWDVSTGAPPAEVAGSTGRRKDVVVDLAFSPDGRWIATAGVGQTARLWSVATGAAHRRLRRTYRRRRQRRLQPGRSNPGHVERGRHRPPVGCALAWRARVS